MASLQNEQQVEDEGYLENSMESSDSSESPKISKTTNSTGTSQATSTESDSNSTSTTDSIEQLQEIVDAMQVQIRNYKQTLLETQNQLHLQITDLQNKNAELVRKSSDKDDKLFKAADTVKSLIGELKEMTDKNTSLHCEILKDKDDLAALYKRLGQLENTSHVGNLNELEVSLVLKLERNKVVSADVLTKSADEQKKDLKLQIEILEKNLMMSKSDILALKSSNGDLTQELSKKNDENQNVKQKNEELSESNKTLNLQINKLTDELSKIRNVKKKTISIKGESNEDISMKEAALEVIRKINNSQTKIFDQPIYDEFALFQKQNNFTPNTFAHVQQKCYETLKDDLDKFMKSSSLITVQKATDYIDIYKEVSSRTYFTTFVKTHSPNLLKYHNVLADVINFNSKFGKKTVKRSPTPGIENNQPQLIQRQRKRRPTISIADDLQEDGLNFSAFKERKQVPLTVSDSFITRKNKGSPEILSESGETPDKVFKSEESMDSEENKEYTDHYKNFKTKMLCWTGKELWAFKEQNAGKTAVGIYTNFSKEVPQQIFNIVGEVISVVYLDSNVFVAKTDNSVTAYNIASKIGKNIIDTSDSNIAHMESCERKVLVFVEGKFYYEINERLEKTVRKLSLLSDIKTVAICGENLWVGTLAGLNVFNTFKKKSKIVKGIPKGEISQLLHANEKVWVVLNDDINVVDVETHDVVKVLSLPVQKLKLIGKFVWILLRNGSVKVYDSQTLELKTEHSISRFTLYDAVPTFKPKLDNTEKEMKEWVCVLCGEENKLFQVGTPFPFHDWCVIENQSGTKTCRCCSKKFKSGGVFCHKCCAVFICDKCRGNPEVFSLITNTDTCSEYSALKAEFIKKEKKK
ncbi:hypothetical protein EIN_019020 [Entamoeba invadens IP1]|uniref:hypothetical protein n=1 Tax=Entamoeba invadens IP1 TaxID=370355 RepID=UPI0002C3F066|nr:hypothetical protein EIN_019020 [Entamoeba invadens IP1]ELP90533.1 hypothetical protein EIN_019020 [Entamoeba invadens IP1]|eukprot:XP_004257304.1 hypothetical protein EIN_019020 [Entamoeba invadens IP1]